MASVIRTDSGDGWVMIRGQDGILYGCQTQLYDWWCRVSGIATVYDVSERRGSVPSDVIQAVDHLCPNRVKSL